MVSGSPMVAITVSRLMISFRRFDTLAACSSSTEPISSRKESSRSLTRASRSYTSRR